MVERQPQRLERLNGIVVAGRDLRHVGPGDQRLQRCIARTEIAMHDQMRDCRQRGAQLGHDAGAIEVAAAVSDAVAGDQDLGLDLLEAVQHGVGAHVGRTEAPDAADARHRQEGDDGFRDVRQVRRHAVAGLHALLLQMQGQGSDLAPQFRPAQLAVLALFVAADDGRKAGAMGLVHVAKDLAHVVELRSFEPLRARHLSLGQHGFVGRR